MTNVYTPLNFFRNLNRKRCMKTEKKNNASKQTVYMIYQSSFNRLLQIGLLLDKKS